MITAMTLKGTSTVYKHRKADTLYLAIPSKLASDSQFAFKAGDKVTLRFNVKTKTLEIVKLK